MKRLGAVVMTAAVTASVLALALSFAAGERDLPAVAVRQAGVAQSGFSSPRQNETIATDRRQRATRTSSHDQDQTLMLLLLLEMGSSASRR